MVNASQYLTGRSYPRLSTDYNIVGIHMSHLRDKAIASIRDNKTPVIIGTGWLSHYPLAFGYAVRKRIVTKCFFGCWKETEYIQTFCVNQGWPGPGHDWVPASTWFVGEAFP
ncbi:hypothetical protein [Leptolyngbya sp. Heron Island J]|uniref:hypothetical protein n=1 Tax=Leptolyngbya sp. Heron Island J TaxID=1385935 RepID=UPI001269596C|nr:hypothetical protein [Leptolyngbya sp. Heron Island J]